MHADQALGRRSAGRTGARQARRESGRKAEARDYDAGLTLRRKGARKIVVDGRPLLYAVFRKGARGCPDCDRLHVIVVGETRKGSVVRIGIDDAWGPDMSITPKLIASAVRLALTKGWRPGEGEGTFYGVNVRDLASATNG